MKKETDVAAELIAIVKKTFNAYFSGNPAPWFAQLSKDSIYLGSGEPALIGKKAIITHFKKYNGVKTIILDEDYHVMMQGKTLGIVYGQITVGIPDFHHSSVTRFTIVYRITKDKYEVIHQHNSYEHQYNTTTNDNASIIMDDITLQFVRNILMHQTKNKKIAIQNGAQTYMVDINMILYIQSIRNKTEVVCANQIISCSQSISELKANLPDVFYPIHRSYIVNINHISKIQRFEAELVNGTVIPIPALTYTQVKRDLEALRSNE